MGGDPLRIGVLVSGRGTNLAAILAAIAAGELPARVACVVSNRPAAPALERARAAGVPALVFPRSDFPSRAEQQRAILRALQQHGVELVVLAGFDQILLPEFVAAFPDRILNVHPSLLPAFGGSMHAVEAALGYGVKVSGCTVHLVTTEVDAGPIVAQAAVPVLEDDDPAALHARIQAEEHRLLPQAIGWFAAGRLRREGRRVRILPPSAASESSPGQTEPEPARPLGSREQSSG